MAKQLSTLQINDFQTKYFNIDPLTIDPITREFKFIASDESQDRQGDIVKLSAFNLDNISRLPINYYHGQAVGKAMWGRIENNQLLIGAKLDSGYPEADKAFLQMQQGSLPFTSIGFSGLKKSINPKGRFIWEEIDLGEVSLCSFPANRNARIKMDYDKIQKAYETEEDDSVKMVYKSFLDNKEIYKEYLEDDELNKTILSLKSEIELLRNENIDMKKDLEAFTSQDLIKSLAETKIDLQILKNTFEKAEQIKNINKLVAKKLNEVLKK